MVDKIDPTPVELGKKIDKIDDTKFRLEETKTEIKEIDINDIKRKRDAVQKQITVIQSKTQSELARLNASLVELNKLLQDAKDIGVEPTAEQWAGRVEGVVNPVVEEPVVVTPEDKPKENV
jgi:chromosome segregation ATPase